MLRRNLLHLGSSPELSNQVDGSWLKHGPFEASGAERLKELTAGCASGRQNYDNAGGRFHPFRGSQPRAAP
jgi:hypothetical protein